jgi:hypothetical protein
VLRERQARLKLRGPHVQQVLVHVLVLVHVGMEAAGATASAGAATPSAGAATPWCHSHHALYARNACCGHACC